MSTQSRRGSFISGLWAGLAAPMGLFELPPAYPRFDGTNSLRRSFAKVGMYVNDAVSRHHEQFGKSTDDRQ